MKSLWAVFIQRTREGYAGGVWAHAGEDCVASTAEVEGRGGSLRKTHSEQCAPQQYPPSNGSHRATDSEHLGVPDRNLLGERGQPDRMGVPNSSPLG